MDSKGIPIVLWLEERLRTQINAIQFWRKKIFGPDGAGIFGKLPCVHINPEHGCIFVEGILVVEVSHDQTALVDVIENDCAIEKNAHHVFGGNKKACTMLFICEPRKLLETGTHIGHRKPNDGASS